MKTPLQVIADLGCSTTSYIAAIQHLITFEFSKEICEQHIQDIVGLPERPECESWYVARVMLLYSVQETIRAYNTGLIPDMYQIYMICVQKTQANIEASPWNETRFNIEHGLRVADDDPDAPLTVPKGAKKEITEAIFKEFKTAGASRQAIIEAFVQRTGMSKAGATTYFHTLKKEFGFKDAQPMGQGADKTESKQELAERLYQDATDKSKAVIITLFTEKLQTSKLGAQTYFYACKKKFNVDTTAQVS